MPLFGEDGERIRGKGNAEAAEVALAREKLSWEESAGRPAGNGDWLVARVYSDYLQYCDRGMASGRISKGRRYNAASWLNDLCGYCGRRGIVSHRVRRIGDHRFGCDFGAHRKKATTSRAHSKVSVERTCAVHTVDSFPGEKRNLYSTERRISCAALSKGKTA